MSKDIIEKVDEVFELTESQKDRDSVAKLSVENLYGFLNGYMRNISSKNALKNKIESLLLTRIEEEEEDLPYGVLIKLLEVLGKNEVEAATPILKIIEAAVKQPESSFNPNAGTKEDEKDESSKVTQDDYKNVKKFLKVIEDLEKTEFPK